MKSGMIHEALLQTPEREWLICGDERKPFRTVAERVQSLASRYAELGVKENDAVGLLFRPSPSVIEAFLALLQCGAKIVLLSGRMRSHDWQKQLEQAGARWCVENGELAEVSGVELLSIDSSARFAASAAGGTVALFSSGTVGTPKLVVHSVSNLMASALAVNQAVTLRAEDTWVLSLPLYHVGGLGILFRTLMAGSRLQVLEDCSVPSILAGVARSENVFLSVVPTQLRELCAHWSARGVPPSLRSVLVGGAELPTELVEEAQKLKIPLLASYGMTETASAVVLGAPAVQRDGRVGIRNWLKGPTIGIVDEEGNSCTPGCIGRVSVQAPWIARDADSATGWLHTNDSAYETPENVFVPCGRLDRMITSGGEKIDPAIIERAANRLLGVAECAVLGVADERWGERPALVVSGGQALTLEKVHEVLSAELPRHYLPERVFNARAFPRTELGKIDYRSLRELVSRSES